MKTHPAPVIFPEPNVLLKLEPSASCDCKMSVGCGQLPSNNQRPCTASRKSERMYDIFIWSIKLLSLLCLMIYSCAIIVLKSLQHAKLAQSAFDTFWLHAIYAYLCISMHIYARLARGRCSTSSTILANVSGILGMSRGFAQGMASLDPWNLQKNENEIFQYLSIPFNIFQYLSISFNTFQYLSIPFIFFSPAIHAKVRAVAETGGHAMSCFDIFYHFLSYNLHRAKALSEGHLSSILMHTSYRLKGQACPTTIETLRHSTSDFLLPYQAVGCRCSGYGREAGG